MVSVEVGAASCGSASESSKVDERLVCDAGVSVRADCCGERWLTDALEAIQSSNEYVELYGLPLDRYRMF